MKIRCETELFTSVCLNIQRSVPAKAVLPHLECILLETEGKDSVRLSGFDLDMGVYMSVRAEVLEEGAAALNAKVFCDILRLLPEETVLISCDEKNICSIVSGKTEYSLMGLNAEEYPKFPEITDKISFRAPQGVLKDMIRRTIFAASQDLVRAVHRGIKFELNPGEIRLVALDGFRLAIRNEFSDYSGDSFSFVAPSKAMSELVRLAEDNENFIEITKGRRHISFKTDDFCLISKLLEGRFLNYQATIPRDRAASIRVNTKLLIDCIERVSVIIPEKKKSPIKCFFNNNELFVSAVTPLGSSGDRIPISISGEKTLIGFNNRFLLDALRSCDTDEVLIILNGPVSPALILPNDGEEFMYLILPVRLKETETDNNNDNNNDSL